ncbi:MAG TPA: coproporphyrinogen dehydrogenase HemZ, partial [Bacillota bacterium]|nr:coproporphyrinogen dehydrogenase HemZ [Bacillota bacterium]
AVRTEGGMCCVTTEKMERDAQDSGTWRPGDTERRVIPGDERRREVKRQLYAVLSRETGIGFPWGSLTGVRPTQIVVQEWERALLGMSPEQARRGGRSDQAQRVCGEVIGRLIRDWYVSEPKAELAFETALAEQRVLSAFLDNPHRSVVYVGLPFCPSRCSYCSFIAQDARRHRESLEPYVDAVIEEARGVFSRGFHGEAAAVYFGGGTPTSLPPPLFKRYVEGVLETIPLAPGAELTMEAGRPDTIDAEKLEVIRENRFTRLCINPQTMHDETLKAIGRGHSAGDTVKAFSLARAIGFDDINMDLIAGLPGENAEDLLRSVRWLLELAPESITLHTLAVKRGSGLIARGVPHALFHPDEALIGAVETAHALLRQSGYAPYYLYRQKNCRSGLENTGFARDGYASLYNVAMMSDRVPVIGLGSGSTSKAVSGRQTSRVCNPKDLLVYIQRVREQIARKRALFHMEDVSR